jgi:hypothetical protein
MKRACDGCQRLFTKAHPTTWAWQGEQGSWLCVECWHGEDPFGQMEAPKHTRSRSKKRAAA